MVKRGRPEGSLVRSHLIDILAVLGKAYGYELHKYYVKLFAPTTRENIYYHLRKGSDLGEIKLLEVKREEGSFSWGPAVEKRYYVIGEKAVVKQDLSNMVKKLKNQ